MGEYLELGICPTCESPIKPRDSFCSQECQDEYVRELQELVDGYRRELKEDE